jgi:trehalose-6-phosphate synthase
MKAKATGPTITTYEQPAVFRLIVNVQVTLEADTTEGLAEHAKEYTKALEQGGVCLTSNFEGCELTIEEVERVS